MRCYVSYAWADEANPDREAQVDALVDAARKNGVDIVRDKDALKAGDRISDFMRRIGGGDRVFVFLSHKYLTSPFCMNELFLIWRNSREDESDFLERVRVYKLDDAKFERFEDRLSYAKYWRSEHDRLKEIIKGSLSEVSDFDYKRFRLMEQFATNIGDILALFSDTVRPRSFNEFLKYGFADAASAGQSGLQLRDPPAPPPSPARSDPLIESGAAGTARPFIPESPLKPPDGASPTPRERGASKWPMTLVALLVLALVGVGAGYLALNKGGAGPPDHSADKPNLDHPVEQPSANTAWCYQVKNGLYVVACHKQQADCAKDRADNTLLPGTGCELVDLSKARWIPFQGGLPGSQYQTAEAPFPNPFPQIAETATPFRNAAQYSVYIQFAGYDRSLIKSLEATLTKQNWNVQVGESTQNAVRLSEVRYHDAQQKAAADALATAINTTGVLNAPVKTLAVAAVQPAVLEVWVGQR
jgi:hypothetical protein